MSIEELVREAAAAPAAVDVEEGVLDEVVVLNPHLRVVPCGHDELLVKHGTRSPYSEVLHDDGRTGLMGRVVSALAAPASLADLVEREVVAAEELPAAQGLVESLLERRILVHPETDLTRVYLETVFRRATAGDRLGEATVGIVGCGALGSRIAAELAAFAPKELVLADPRLAAPPPLALENGRPTVELVAAASLGDEAALDEVFSRSDFVVVAYESFSPLLLHTANEVAIRHGTPWMSVYFDGSEGVIGPTYVIGETCCYHEFEVQAQASLAYRGEYLVYKEFLRDGAAEGGFVLPAYAMVAAGWAVTSTLRFLLEGATFTVGRALHVNFETLSIDVEDVLKLPRCPACSGERPTYRNLFL